MSALVGATWLLIFGIFRDKIAVYRTRLVRPEPRPRGLGAHPPRALQPAPGAQDMPNVWIKPPPLPVGGIKQLWRAPSAIQAARTLRE